MSLQNFDYFYNGTPGTLVYDASTGDVLGFRAAEEYGGWCTALTAEPGKFKAELVCSDKKDISYQDVRSRS